MSTPEAPANQLLKLTGREMQHRSRSHRAVIRIYDAAVNVIQTHEHKSDFKEWQSTCIAL